MSFYMEEEKKKILDVKTYHQFPDYPTGCEVISLYLLLKFYNVDVTPMELVDKIKKGQMPRFFNGNYYGDSPLNYFIGNPTSRHSYGVYNTPIGELANCYKKGAIIKNDFDEEDIISLIKQDRPVVAWVTIHLNDPFVSAEWLDLKSGEKIEWYSGEHAVVVMGYTDDEFIVSDPYTGSIRYFSKEKFRPVYKKLGKRVVYY